MAINFFVEVFLKKVDARRFGVGQKAFARHQCQSTVNKH